MDGSGALGRSTRAPRGDHSFAHTLALSPSNASSLQEVVLPAAHELLPVVAKTAYRAVHLIRSYGK